MRLVDKSKKANIKCEYCDFFNKDECKCILTGQPKNYWNRCKRFAWNRSKAYVQDQKGNKSFIDACLSGEVSPDKIDGYVKLWHEHETQTSLCQFLGMTSDEYALWVKEGNDVLPDILAAHKEG